MKLYLHFIVETHFIPCVSCFYNMTKLKNIFGKTENVSTDK